MTGGIQTVAATIQYEESRDISMLTAALDCSKNDTLRGIIRFAFTKPEELGTWLAENPLIWRKYVDES